MQLASQETSWGPEHCIFFFFLLVFILPFLNERSLNDSGDTQHTDTNAYTNNYMHSSHSCCSVRGWERTRIDRALALINDKLRRPYNSATTFDLGVLSQIAKREATCEKVLSTSGPQAP